MTTDEALAERVRDVLAEWSWVWTEQRMFGGLGFMIDDHLAVAASSRGGLMLRADPARAEEFSDDPRVSPFEMRGRPMKGWLHAAVDADVAEEDLRAWVGHSVGYAASLPPKGTTSARAGKS